MKALILGASGQLGRALLSNAPTDVEIVAHGSDTLDITDAARVDAAIATVRPDIILNAAAYTAVDKAESDKERAMAVNGTAVGVIGRAAAHAGARFVHVSTDFVFDGLAGTPYMPHAPTRPLSVYGQSKLLGEQLAGPDALIVRTAWVYAPYGHNFVFTMLRLMRERPEIQVVADQIGTPTYVPGLATALWGLVEQERTGFYHYTDSGVASWYDFAVAIQEEALALGLLERAVPIRPIATTDFPVPARRPSYSLLDKSATYAVLGPAPHWRANLRIMLAAAQTS